MSKSGKSSFNNNKNKEYFFRISEANAKRRKESKKRKLKYGEKV